jgi:hypothetical protein
VKTLAWLAGVATLVAAGAYMVASVYRWEWNRALYFGLIVVIAEVALATGLVLRKLTQIAASRPADPVRSALASSRSHPGRGRRCPYYPVVEPASERLRMWGRPSDAEHLSWSWVQDPLKKAGTYWVVARGGSHPHPRPVWGVWMPKGCTSASEVSASAATFKTIQP